MAWSTSDIPDLMGHTAVVTGANGGLGLETTRALSRAGAHVLVAARDQEKANSAVTGLRADDADASLEIVELDLGSLASVHSAADTILSAHDSIEILVNNAGLMAMPERKTADGFEMQLGVNHLGHFALTAHLLPPLLRAETSRVVTVTSTAHHMGRALDPDNPHLHGRYKPWRSYSQSKLANYHFGLGLQRRFQDAGVRASSLLAHPGLSNTDLQGKTVAEGGGGTMAAASHKVATVTGMPAAKGALPQIRAATDPGARGGEFFAPRFINNGPPVRRPVLRRLGLDKAIENLWLVSERETGVTLDVAAAQAGLSE